MRLVCVSDTHMRKIHPSQMPPGDVLIHAGDLTTIGSFQQLAEVGLWLKNQPYRYKVVIAGNHDKLFERDYRQACIALGFYGGEGGLHYLQDSGVTIEGVSFYGSPWTPRFFDWAFQLEGEDKPPTRERADWSYPKRRPDSERPFLLGSKGPRTAQEHWSKLPDGIDVLVTHGPPWGILDGLETIVGDGPARIERLGDRALRATVDRIRPKLHVFGHIHYGYGTARVDGSLYVNAATCDERYEPVHRPVVVDLVDGKATAVLGR